MYCVQAILKSSHRKRMTDDKKISQRCRSHIILMRLRRRVKKLQGDTAAQKKTKFTMLRRLYSIYSLLQSAKNGILSDELFQYISFSRPFIRYR
jgi:hypothetical protein